MIPNHCREVGVRRVDFPLSRDSIVQHVTGKAIYAATNYLLLNNGTDWAILGLEKMREPSLFSKIVKVEVISLPDSTMYAEDPDIDVNNVSATVAFAEDLGAISLVVKGSFEHLSFVHQERTLPLVVFDVVPPEPAKIAVLAEAALATGRIRKPIRIMPEILDLSQAAQERHTQQVMFPCYAASLEKPFWREALFLDQRPVLPVQPNEITLVGCDVSTRIFRSVYGTRPADVINMCPKNLVRDTGVPNLSRCCIIDEGHRIEGKTAFVSWGASVGEVEEAIIDLLGLEVESDALAFVGDSVSGSES